MGEDNAADLSIEFLLLINSTENHYLYLLYRIEMSAFGETHHHINWMRHVLCNDCLIHFSSTMTYKNLISMNE